MEKVNRNKIAIYKRGKEPNNVLYWLQQPAYKRILALEEICLGYNTWKYGSKQEFQRVYNIIKRPK